MSDKNFKVKNGLDANGAVTITQPSTSTVPLTILANTLATGSNLLEVKRPDGTVRFAVGNDGALTVNSNISFNGGSMSMYPGNSGQTALSVFGQTNQSVANLIVRAATGQSGNVQEWRDQNNNVAARIGPDFAFRSIAGGFFGTATGNIVGSNYLGVRGWDAGHIPFVVQGFASQTGDLTRWVDSSANTLAKVDASGSITAVDLTLSGNLTVNGTTTNLNSTNLIIEDKNIIIADVATPTDTTADGAGITIKGATDKTLNWVQSTGSFTSSEPFIVNATSATVVPLIARAYASQTSNLFEVQNSASNKHFVVKPPAGTALTDSLVFVKGAGTGGRATIGAFSSYGNFAITINAGQSILFGTEGGGSSFEVVTGNIFNRYKVIGTGTGVAPVFTTDGNDTDVNMHIYPKGAGKIGVNTTTPTGYVHIKTPSASVSTLIVQGESSQSANLTEWHNSAGTVLSRIDAGGNIVSPYVYTSLLQNTTAGKANLQTNQDTGAIGIYTSASANKGLIVRGAASQTGNLQEWQDSDGNLLSAIRSDGVLRVSQVISKENYSSFFSFSSGSPIQVNPLTAGTIGIVVKGSASQTANLQEWQNSSGTVLASISSTGKLTSASDALINGITLGWGGGQSYQNLTFGYSALLSNTTGVLNMAMGYRALQANTTGWNNMALGADALVANTTGQANTAIGAQSLYGNTNGGENVAIGNWALLGGNGAYNTAVGASSMNLNSSSQFNTAVGRLSLYSISYGSHNTAIGQQAGGGLTSGASNAILGSEALILATTGSSNVAVGRDAGHSVVTGSANVFLGYQAGYSETGSNKLYISNSNTATPLIGGDFSAKTLTVAGNATITSQATGTVGLIVKAIASQTANLQEWQGSSGNVISVIDAYGALYLKDTAMIAPTASWAADRFAPGGLTIINRGTASHIPLGIRGTASQTANLTEWQNSAGTSLVNISSSGVLNTNANINLIGVSANGLNRTIDYGNSYGAAALYLYNAGANARWGWGLNAGEMQFFATNDSATNHFSWNRGGDLQAVGTNEIMRLTVGTGATSTLNLNTGGTAATGLVIKGVASQTANLQEWQNSAGTVLAAISSSGVLKVQNIIDQNNSGATFQFSSTSINAYTFNPATTPFTVNGAASQTADLQQWKNSAGIVGAYVASDGSFVTRGSLIGGSYSGNALFGVQNYSTTQVVAVVKGAASQTANLQEWQDSSGTVLSNITYFGGARLYDLGIKGSPAGIGWAYFGNDNTSTKNVVVRGFASQTASLQEWQDSGGSVLSRVSPAGSIFVSSSGTRLSGVGGDLLAIAASATVVPITSRGFTSQTANLQEWQSSAGSVLTSVSPTGKLTITNTSASAALIEVLGAGGGQFTVSQNGGISTNGGFQSIGASSYFGGYGGASNLVLNVTGASGQTGDLQRWTTFAGTILAKVDSLGNFTATSKSFDIEHPTKENMRLRYGSLEGPENGVYIRGTVESNVIELPEYWTELVHKDSITASLTSVGSAQNIYVEKIENNKIYIGGNLEKAFFTVYGERKDIDKLTVEY